MQKAEITPGQEYALRETRASSSPFQRVRVLQHVRGTKWKAEWIEPNLGLIDYVESKMLIVPWKERKPFLRDEAADNRLSEENERRGYKRESPIDNALYSVFESTGEGDLDYLGGELRGPPEALNRVRVRAKVAADKTSPVTYVDRFGTIHVPFDEALALAQGFCAAEPAAVLPRVETTEREWSAKASRPGGEYMVGLLNEYRAAWALIRQWTGHDPYVAEREASIQRLERLVWDAIYALQKAGLDNESNRLRRALGRD